LETKQNTIDSSEGSVTVSSRLGLDGLNQDIGLFFLFHLMIFARYLYANTYIHIVARNFKFETTYQLHM
jgi:hypothetical protein